MSETIRKKAFQDETMESVSGGSDRELWELVQLYNRYNPDAPLKNYSTKIERWVAEVWGYPSTGTLERPLIFDADGYRLNSYLIPGVGSISHEDFLRQTEQKAAERALKKG